MVEVTLQINAPPSLVRSIVLDFPNYPAWHTSFIKHIAADKPGIELEPGDIVRTSFDGADDFRPKVMTNSPDEFRWVGSLNMGAFGGEHYFKFQPGGDEQETVFVHGEDHTGWLSVLFRPGWPLNERVERGFRGFAEDVKKRAEDSGMLEHREGE